MTLKAFGAEHTFPRATKRDYLMIRRALETRTVYDLQNRLYFTVDTQNWKRIVKEKRIKDEKDGFYRCYLKLKIGKEPKDKTVNA